VVREGLRLVEEREAKLRDLKATIEASIAEGGALTADEVRAQLRRTRDEMQKPAHAAE
jgi:antitoxin ParD1/3/4